MLISYFFSLFIAKYTYIFKDFFSLVKINWTIWLDKLSKISFSLNKQKTRVFNNLLTLVYFKEKCITCIYIKS